MLLRELWLSVTVAFLALGMLAQYAGLHEPVPALLAAGGAASMVRVLWP